MLRTCKPSDPETLLHQVDSRILTRPTTTYSATAAATTRRPFCTEVADTSSGDDAFTEAWKKVVPNIDPPKTPNQFMQPRPPTPSTFPTKLTVNFFLPYASKLSQKEVALVELGSGKCSRVSGLAHISPSQH